jgi:hypothetical protein
MKNRIQRSRSSEKHEIALEGVRARRKNVATPSLVRSKRNRGANQEDRTRDFGGRRRR